MLPVSSMQILCKLIELFCEWAKKICKKMKNLAGFRNLKGFNKEIITY